jgi:hypothetical protein
MLTDLTELQNGLATLQRLLDEESKAETNELEANLASLHMNMASLQSTFVGDAFPVEYCFGVVR